jgi:hypothetical protein
MLCHCRCLPFLPLLRPPLQTCTIVGSNILELLMGPAAGVNMYDMALIGHIVAAMALTAAAATNSTMGMFLAFLAFEVSVFQHSKNDCDHASHLHIYSSPSASDAARLRKHVTSAVPMFSLRMRSCLIRSPWQMAVGMFYPSYSMIKSSHIQEEVRSTVMNYFRIPLNAFVALALVRISHFSSTVALVVAACLHVLALCIYVYSRSLLLASSEKGHEDEEGATGVANNDEDNEAGVALMRKG